MTARPNSLKSGCVVACAWLLAACSTVDSALQGDKVDYKSASKSKAPELVVPPDLTQLQRDPQLAAALGDEGMRRAFRHYTWRHVARKAAAIYADVVGRQRPDARPACSVSRLTTL